MNSTVEYADMCSKATLPSTKEITKLFQVQPEDFEYIKGVSVWCPTLSQLEILIQESTKKCWEWRHKSKVNEDPLSLLLRIHEFSSKLTLGSCTSLQEVFLDFFMNQEYHLNWNFKVKRWDPWPDEMKSFFSQRTKIT